MYVSGASGVHLCWKERWYRNLFYLYLTVPAKKTLRSPYRESVSHFPSLLGVGGEGREKEVPVSEPLAAPCRLGSLSMKSALGTSQQQEMKLLQNQRETLFALSAQLLLFPLFGAAPDDYTKKSLSINCYEYLNTKKCCHDIKVLMI